MTILFGNLGDGSTMRAFGTVATAASLAAIAFGAEVERYAQVHRPTLPLTSISKPGIAWLPQPRLNGIDYATTGSFEPEGQREFVELEACGDILGQH
jgi:hypothetical protein